MTDDKQDPSVVAWVWRMRVRLNSVSDWGSWSEWGIGKHNCTDTFARSALLVEPLTSDLTAMKAELEEAKKERDMFEHAASALSTDLFDFDERLKAVEQERDELREALKPFAEVAAEMNENTKPDDWTAWGYNDADLTYGDFRRARTALSKPKPHDETRGRG